MAIRSSHDGLDEALTQAELSLWQRLHLDLPLLVALLLLSAF
jgi:hypothetical protein